MRELIESVAIEGTTLAVALRPPLPADHATVALAVAIRLLERYPVVTEVAVVCGADEQRLSRVMIERLIGPDELAEAGGPRRRAILARAVDAFREAPPA